MSSEPTQYKNTVLLPQTAFPMQANLAKREPEMLARWEAAGLYKSISAITAGRPKFHLVDGPPYANGDIHIGHAVNKVLKDMVVKAARLNGHDAPFVPGWDCHGLPIELQVEKKFGKVGEKLSASEFRAHCRTYAGEQMQRQREDFKRLGILADWERPYLTMQPAFEAEQLRVLARVCKRGHVVRGFKPVHWCLDCSSSLAEAEVEYQDKQSVAVDVAFKAVDPADLARRFGLTTLAEASFVIWTTTPWTLPANQAITVHADLDYRLVRIDKRRLIVASELVDALAKRMGEDVAVGPSIKGAMLAGAMARHPFADREVPIICGEHVTLDAGTGLVHTAPAHGVEDFVVGKQYGLPVDNPVGSNGVFLPFAPLVAGMHVRKVEEPILAALEASGALLHRATITHSYPHCWRHKTPLIFRATPQWFISMDAQGLRKNALAEIAATRWIPEWGKERIGSMIATRPDWCISRQRYWGVPLAVFVHKEQQSLHPDTPALLARIANKVEAEGLEAWFGSTAADWGVDESVYEKGSDTLDVWFDSGVVFPASFVSTRMELPEKADMYLEGSDQHRGWFHSSLLTRVATNGIAPYRSVLTHGFTVDEQGRKMSKSLGNVVAPQKVNSTLGADVLRLWVASSDYSGEIAISEKLLTRTADAYRRIRNTARYLLGSLHGFEPGRHAKSAVTMVAVDRWAIAQAAKLQDELKAAYDACEFHRVYHALHNYCVNDLGGLYLDMLKDRLYTLPEGSAARRSAQTALWHLAEAMVRWIAPILSFTADEIWQSLPGERSASVFAQTWWVFPEVKHEAEHFAQLVAVRDVVRKSLEELRIAGIIGSSLQAEVSLYVDARSFSILDETGPELRFWLQTSAVQIAPLSAAPEGLMPAQPLGNGGSIRLRAKASSSAKCERCWHYCEDVGRHAGHESICGRCVENLSGAGESRRWF